jgi:hypothetical protein
MMTRYLFPAVLFALALNAIAYSAEPRGSEFQAIFFGHENLSIRPDDESSADANEQAPVRKNLALDKVHRFVVSIDSAKDVMVCKLFVPSDNPRIEKYLQHNAIPARILLEDLQRINEGESVFKVVRFTEDGVAGTVTATTASTHKTPFDLLAESSGTVIAYVELVPNKKHPDDEATADGAAR